MIIKLINKYKTQWFSPSLFSHFKSKVSCSCRIKRIALALDASTWIAPWLRAAFVYGSKLPLI